MTKTTTQKPVILFVDDEEPLRMMFTAMMPEKLTDQVDFRVAADGTEALAIIEETRGILIGLLTDLGLGVEKPDGKKVAKVALDAGVKHIAICTGSSEYDKDQLIPEEIRDRVRLILKPYDLSTLMTFVEEAVQSST
ncbi:MAG: hypothetical protein AAB739_01640 [Patescibacteria group bacterium]